MRLFVFFNPFLRSAWVSVWRGAGVTAFVGRVVVSVAVVLMTWAMLELGLLPYYMENTTCNATRKHGWEWVLQTLDGLVRTVRNTEDTQLGRYLAHV